MKPCIVAVGYNRPASLKRLLNSISQAVYQSKDIPLIISLDKAENDNGCLEVANNFKWEYGTKEVRTFEKRLGLREHILKCGELSNKYGSVIILEDDLLVSPMFYIYAERALEYYKDDNLVSGISLYSHEWNGYANKFFNPILDGNDVFLGQFSITWGECWTKKWWNAFIEWYNSHQVLDENNPLLPSSLNKWPKSSWGKYFITYLVEKDLYYIIPRFSLTTNCSDPGEHAINTDSTHQVRLLESKKYDYSFSPSNELKKYDIFFESIDLKEYLEKELNDTVCINLFGNKDKKSKSRYMLTTLPLKNKIIKSFGLSLRPIEQNIYQDFPGKSIFLYDSSIKGKKPKIDKFATHNYEFRTNKLENIPTYYFCLLHRKIKRKIKKR